jgi:hypothetical protein
MVNVGTFSNHLEYFMSIRYNLWPFGIVCGHLLYFFPIWYVRTKKNLATLYLIMGARKNETTIRLKIFLAFTSTGKYFVH